MAESLMCRRFDDRPASARRVVLINPDGTDGKTCGPYCDPCTDALLKDLIPTYHGGAAAYRVDREENTDA